MRMDEADLLAEKLSKLEKRIEELDDEIEEWADDLVWLTAKVKLLLSQQLPDE